MDFLLLCDAFLLLSKINYVLCSFKFQINDKKEHLLQLKLLLLHLGKNVRIPKVVFKKHFWTIVDN